MKPDVQRIFTKLAKEKVELGLVNSFDIRAEIVESKQRCY